VGQGGSAATAPTDGLAEAGAGTAPLWDVVRSAGLGLFDLDLRGGRLQASERALDMLRLGGSAAVDLQRLAAHADPVDRERLLAALLAAVDPAGSGVFDVQYRSTGPDGALRWLGARGRARFDGEGKRRSAVRLLGVLLDVTERVDAETRLDEEHEWLTLAVTAGQMGIWEWNFTKGTRRWNDAMYGLYGVDRSAVTRLAPPYIEEILPEDGARVQQAIVELRARGGSAQVEFRIRRKDNGQVRWVTSRGVMRHDPVSGDERMLGVTYDITERKTAEQKLVEDDRRKDEFLAMLAHELRNPLAPLVNAIRILETTGSGDAAGRAALGIADRQLRQLTRLVDDLLEVARITRGRIELRRQPMVVDSAVREAVTATALALEARSLHLVLDLAAGTEPIVADAARLRQVVENLLANAIKYTEPGGTIRVSSRQEGGVASVCVADDGIGIDAEALTRIFDLFVQIDDGIDRTHGGLGIGLALVKRLVELHGGSVVAASAGRGRGASFTVRLPCAVPQEGEQRRRAGDPLR
jgi:PAS domain S-box-containing protein